MARRRHRKQTWGEWFKSWFSSPKGQEFKRRYPGIEQESLPHIASAELPGGETLTTVQKLTQPQLDIQKQMQSAIGPLLQQLTAGGGGFDFAPIAEQARTQFKEQTIPSIAERFTGMGGGAQSTEAFKRSLGQAGAGLEQGLAAQQAGMGLKSQFLRQQLLSQLLGVGLQSPSEMLLQPKSPGFMSSLGSGLGQAAGYALPIAARAGLGALTGL